MSFQVMVAVETLRTLVALERTFVMRGLLLTAIHLLHLSAVPAVEPRDHAAWKAMGHRADHRHLAARAVHVGHDGAGHAAATVEDR